MSTRQVYNQTVFFPNAEEIVQLDQHDNNSIYYHQTGVIKMGGDIEYLVGQVLDLEEQIKNLKDSAPQNQVSASHLKTALKAEGIALGVLLILAVMAVAGISVGMQLNAGFNTQMTHFFTHMTLKQGLLFIGTPGFSLIGIALAGLAIAALKDKYDENRKDSALPEADRANVKEVHIPQSTAGTQPAEPSWFEGAKAYFSSKTTTTHEAEGLLIVDGDGNLLDKNDKKIKSSSSDAL